MRPACPRPISKITRRGGRALAARNSGPGNFLKMLGNHRFDAASVPRPISTITHRGGRALAAPDSRPGNFLKTLGNHRFDTASVPPNNFKQSPVLATVLWPPEIPAPAISYTTRTFREARRQRNSHGWWMVPKRLLFFTTFSPVPLRSKTSRGKNRRDRLLTPP